MSKEEVNIAKGLGRGIELAEDLRNKISADNLFAGIFNGQPPFSKVFSGWSKISEGENKNKDELLSSLSRFLTEDVDPYEIDSEASIPLEVFEKMSRLGLYGVKIPENFGGKGLSNSSYLEALSYAASWSSAIYIVLSAHNTIGCPFPVEHYGTEEQKAKFLPEFAKWPTAFCLTEKEAGSDASKIKAHAVRVVTADGKIVGYRLFGQKLYPTNGILSDRVPLARYLAVVARIVNHPNEIETEKDPKKFCYGLFIVPSSSKGVDIGTRNLFIGMRGIHNSNPKFNDVFVPVFSLIGEKRQDWESALGWGPREGSGLKIAFESLNTGRIAIAQGCVGVAKQALHISRWWARKRNQLGGQLQSKELIRDKILNGAGNILAMEAMVKYASSCLDNGQDVRLEAAAAKVFCSEKAWQIVDDMMQIRGGRGYEAWQSLSKRELTPPDDMIWLSARPNRIFEGANEILVQFLFREGTDKYIKVARPLMAGKSSLIAKMNSVLHLAGYYSNTFVPANLPELDYRFSAPIRFIEESCRQLARKVIAKSAQYKTNLASKQLMIDRFSRIAINLGAMTLALAYSDKLNKDGISSGDYSHLADAFYKTTRNEVELLFRQLDNNDDEYRFEISGGVIRGDFDGMLLSGISLMDEQHMKGPQS